MNQVIEYIVIKIRKNEEEFILVQVYFNTSVYISRNLFHSFLQRFLAVFTGDFNVHPLMWESKIEQGSMSIII